MSRATPLTVEARDGELRIRIGVETLKWAAEAAPEAPLTIYDDEANDFVGTIVHDPDKFALDVVTELLREEEDGTTPVHLLLDRAMWAAIENGSGYAEPPQLRSDRR